MKDLKEIMYQRQLKRSKSYLADAIPKDVYEYKTKKARQSFEKKQNDLMFPKALARLTKRHQDI